MSDEMRGALDERRDLIEQRANAVLRGALADNESWITSLGPIPKGKKRETWWRAARTVAAYRDRYQITDDQTPLGTAPVTTRQKIDAARAQAALAQARRMSSGHLADEAQHPATAPQSWLGLQR